METILGSGVVAALVTLIVNGIFKIIGYKREDAVRELERAEARKDRELELDEARKVREAANDLEERRDQARREHDRLDKRTAEGRSYAQQLLRCLDALDKWYDGEEVPRSYDTYSYNRDLNRPIKTSTRLIPDADFRELVDLGMQVINELWVPARVGDGPEEPGQEQRRILRSLMDQAGRFITDDGWDRSLLIEWQGMKDEIDEFWNELHPDTP